ncbi:hypothetical protein LTR36_003326 [Oleoguttula mirabilis]|uniref:Uncharacterized protein n=1 Tax=Oleoguttula mirabilis TaxID=1507867 RepID=A0AAV9JXR0_9PEZI|nr:hypothetical protein LTR36_003326 [Oleoguttula mirabilis]
MTDTSGTPISPVGQINPELTISAASINNEPVELDGTPTSPERLRRGSKPLVLENLGTAERERRARLHSERQADPAVLVDIPQTPQATELEMSGATKEEASSLSGRPST